MIELIFVIVIMGIIGKFGVEFLAQAYNNFIFSSVNNSLQAKSATTAEFISTRLQHRIKDSIIAKKSSDNSFVALGSATGDNYDILEWVGADIDGFRGNSENDNMLPNWSGIVDLDLSSAEVIKSPETNTTKINSLINTLSYNDSSISDSAIYFVGSNSDIVDGYGWNGAITNQNQTMHPIQAGTNLDEFNSSIAGVKFSELYEYYKLAWSAYAVVHSSDGNLTLYYDYQPWLGESYTDGKSSIIMQGVDTFQFMAIGSLVKIQVCVNSNLVEDYSLCKEKTIY
jgi:hypothetical protein